MGESTATAHDDKGEERAVELLDENLAQEKEALRTVEKISSRVSNESAKMHA